MAGRPLLAFLVVSIDGFSEDPDGSIGWMNLSDDFSEFSVRQLREIGHLVFGRTTYDGMASYWQSDEARRGDPVVTELMASTPKTVLSSSGDAPPWRHVAVVTDRHLDAVAALKDEPGRAVAVLGSATLTTDLLGAGLVDEVRLLVSPVVLGRGRSPFAGLAAPVRFELATTTTFASGNVLLCYRPVGADAR